MRCARGGRGRSSLGRIAAVMFSPTPSTFKTHRQGDSTDCELLVARWLDLLIGGGGESIGVEINL